MINTIIFDIGNVLADFTWKEHFERLGYTGQLFERIAKATVLSEDWNECDRGVLSDEEILKRFAAKDPEIGADIRRCFINKKGMVSRNDYAIEWIEELKQRGYKVLYLSNFSGSAAVECSEALDFIPHMDGGIMSCNEKVIKPMPQIYKLLIDRYDLEPEKCVFIDDTEKNLTGASGFGIHTVLFKNLKQAKEDLEKLLSE